MASMPRRELLAQNVTIVPILVLGLVSYFVQAIPAPAPGGGNGYPLALAAAAVICAFQLTIIGWARGWRPLAYPYAWVVVFLIGTLFQSIAVWSVLRTGLPWLAATVTGTPHTEQFHMRTKSSRGSRMPCAYQLVGGPLSESPVPGAYLCITEATYLQAPDAEVHVTLSGLRTSLGMRVTSIDDIEVKP